MIFCAAYVDATGQPVVWATGPEGEEEAILRDLNERLARLPRTWQVLRLQTGLIEDPDGLAKGGGL